MRALSTFLLLFIVFTSFAAAQGDIANWRKDLLADPLLARVEQKAQLKRYDLGSLWIADDNSTVFGFIGKNHQRIRVKLISAETSRANSFVYNVAGASLVGETFRTFKGTISVASVRFYRSIEPELAAEQHVKKRGILLADYRFVEEGADPHTGVFTGTLFTAFYIDDAAKIRYDDIEDGADAFRNNQFAGRWRSLDGKMDLECNWGDSRIPLSGDLDIGDGEFSPNPKYFKNGWQGFHDAYINQDAEAIKQEQRVWWANAVPKQ